jgi:hypothetical protein
MTSSNTDNRTTSFSTHRLQSSHGKDANKNRQKEVDIILCHRTGALANDTRITEERTIPPYIIDRRCTEKGKEKRKGAKENH